MDSAQALEQLPLEELLDLYLRKRNTQGLIHQLYPGEGPHRRDLYGEHMRYFTAGSRRVARMAMGGNGIGKSLGIGGFETALHLTGQYPDWWEGARYRKPVRWWISGGTAKTTRDYQQSVLLGPVNVEAEGGGLIPTDCIDLDSIRRWPNTGGLIDHVRIRHASGGWSHLGARAVSQGLGAYFGENLDGAWMDEPHPLGIYSEIMARTRGSDRPCLLLTLTPKGLDAQESALIEMFTDEPDPSRELIQIGWDDVPHLTEAWKRETLANTAKHMRETVKNGVLAAGSGAVYPVSEDRIVIDPLSAIPDHWPRCFGFDGGWHNTAVIWGAYDRDSGIWYLYSEHKAGETLIPVHAAVIKARGAWIPGLGDIYGSDQTDGKKVRSEYRDCGVRIIPAKKQGKEARVEKVRSMLLGGRIRVYSTLTQWLKEFRMYHYDDNGKIVKVNDHLMDATAHLIDEGTRHMKTRSQAETRPAQIPEKRFGRRI